MLCQKAFFYFFAIFVGGTAYLETLKARGLDSPHVSTDLDNGLISRAFFWPNWHQLKTVHLAFKHRQLF